MADQLSTRAKGAESLDLPSFAKIGINEAIEQLNQKADGGATEYMFRVAASRDLVDIRNWWSKFAMLVDWAGACTSDPERASLDWFISDALGNTSVLQDLLGDQDSLADALICLIEIADGVRSIDEKKASDADTTEATAAKINLLWTANCRNPGHRAERPPVAGWRLLNQEGRRRAGSFQGNAAPPDSGNGGDWRPEDGRSHYTSTVEYHQPGWRKRPEGGDG